MNNSIEKYLPIGTVVLLKEATKKIMVIGFAVKGKENPDQIYDYAGVLYPEGMISSDKNLLFNHEQIAQVFSIGYSNEEEKNFKVQLKNMISQIEGGSETVEQSNNQQPIYQFSNNGQELSFNTMNNNNNNNDNNVVNPFQ